MKLRADWRGAAIGLGAITAGLGCYGAWEFGLQLEGGRVSYLTIAAPVVAAAAALIPPIAEHCWRQRMYLKCLLWWLILVPAAATVFFSSAERVHVAKSGAEAERAAYRSAVARASAELVEAKAEAKAANADADKTKGWKTCGNSCGALRATAERANSRLNAAEASLLAAEKRATTDSALAAPVWLMPAALDLIAFMAIWTGLTGPRPRQRQAVRVKKRAKKKTTRSKTSATANTKTGQGPQRKSAGGLGSRVRLVANGDEVAE